MKWQVIKPGLFFDKLLEVCTNKLKSQQVGAKINKLHWKPYYQSEYYLILYFISISEL